MKPTTAQAWPVSMEAVAPQGISPRQLYCALLRHPVDDSKRHAAQRYLNEQFRWAAALETDLPDDPGALTAWLQNNADSVGDNYRAYLRARRDGAPRRFFSSRSQALHYLGSIAPTKLVDGAWLFGLVYHWHDPRFYGLIRTYIEELGEGRPEHNHVVLYQRLLAAHGCENRDRLSENHYVQGAIQLALAYNAERFLPEIIGYNLGYEQMPLHMLITAYELNELGIDPTYFRLHVTIDNADSGHATRAVRSVCKAQPLAGDRTVFYERVANGYRLNALGLGASAIANAFDLKREVVAMLQRKSAIGKYVHSDYHRIGGRSVTQWLADPAQIPAFLEILQAQGWIKRHQPPRHSRFWRLVEGERAAMYGVFNAYERQLLYDWIAGDCVSDSKAPRRQGQDTFPSPPRKPAPGAADSLPADAGDFNHEQRLLERAVARQPTHDAVMRFLAEYMSPSRHHTAAGLGATRLYAKRLG